MRILLIEDNTKFAQTLKLSLEQHGYSVDVAANAQDGDEAAMVDNHDVVILDVMLPDLDGVQLCRRLRRQKVTTPILMLSALGSSEPLVKRRPLTPSRITSRTGSVLEATTAHPQDRTRPHSSP
jgi:DNA-binding response OmpR family regulator